jgi:RNA polymerase sigma-70 factor, ECF subfamily
MSPPNPAQQPFPGEGMVEPEFAAPYSAEAPSGADSSARATALVRENLQFIWRILRRLGLSPSDADDATQRVFFTAVQRIDQIQPGCERAFLYRTAARIASKLRAAGAGRFEPNGMEALSALPDSAPTPEDLSDRRNARALLDEVLLGMPTELHTVFVLFEIESLTVSEIAETLDIPRGTAASRLRRARADFDQRVLRLEAQMKFRRGEP